MSLEQRLIDLKGILDKKVWEFVTWWGTCHSEMAEDIDDIMSEIKELEETIKLEKDKKIKKRVDK